MIPNFRLKRIMHQRPVFYHNPPHPRCHKLAEREGFEPPDPCGSVVFKTTPFGHSGISPRYIKQ
jgi:hypothetical protein